MHWDNKNKIDLLVVSGLFFGSLTWSAYIGLKICNNIHGTKDWVETPCVIESVRVCYGRGHDTETVWEIQYRYEYGGREYTSQRYNILREHLVLLGGIAPGYSTGQHTVCFVNVDKPQEAVLDVEWRIRELLVGVLFVPLSLFVISIVLLCRFYKMVLKN